MTSATVGAIDIVAWFVYLFSAVLFVVGLHFMNSPKTARKGNQISAFGMVVAVLMAFIVLFAKGFVNIVAVVVLVVGILIGAVAGVVSAKKVKMTDMPQLVSVFNTVGGGAAALVALNDILTKEGTPDIVVLITAGLGILIGSVTFTGSLIAAGKLQGIKWVKKLNLPGKGVWNILFAVLSVVSLVMLCVQPEQRLLWSILTTVFALCYGLVFVIPIGGADMPVVISVLNACTGTAVAMSGLAIDNVALIVAGALVGSAGVTLSILMAQAMNRPLLSVLAGGFGGGADAAAAGDGPEGTMKETTPDDLAVQLVYAQKVIFVPGFGLAQAQAQRELADLGELLKGHGVEVSYAIHPVAGRMPGHMNVLLAEANVPYEELVDLDEINPQFPQANVALVVGANDVTNPAARRPGTPVSGMPILDVDKSQNVVVMKRGRGMGYAGIQNELYFEDNTQMLFGDAKKSLQSVIAAISDCGYSSVVSQFTDNAEEMFRLPHSLAALLVKVASHVSKRKAGYRFEDASCVKALRHATIPMMFIHGGADTFVNPKYLDINYNACASIDREKLLIPGSDHTMSASTDPDRYWRRVNSFVKRVFGL